MGKGTEGEVGVQGCPESEEQIGHRADDKHEDNDDQGERVSLLHSKTVRSSVRADRMQLDWTGSPTTSGGWDQRAAGPAYFASSPAATARFDLDLVRLPDRLDQSRVEEGQRGKRDEEPGDKEWPGHVYEYVDGIIADGRLNDHVWRLRCHRIDDLDDVTFEESRQVVEHGEQPDGPDHGSNPGHGAVLRWLERLADGHVAVGRDDDDEPDRASLGDGGDGPDVGLDVVGPVAPGVVR